MNAEDTHLLIVDDEPSICEILYHFLVSKGYSVHTALSGDQALEILHTTSIDLIVTDIKMPGMTGVDLLKHVKDNLPTVPVLMTTGFPTLDTAIEALKLGAFDYLTKPFHLEEIGEKIKRALKSKQLHEENLLFSKLVSLHEITKILASTLDINDLNFKFLDYSAKIARADGGSLMFVNSNGAISVLETFGRQFDKEYWRSESFFLNTCKWVMTREEPIVVEKDSKNLPSEMSHIPEEIKSYICFPLKTPSRKIGVLNLIRSAGRDSFSNLDLEIVNVLASQASISIDNVRLYQNIHDNYLKTIRAFALAVEAKDEYTHGHSENVMKYTVVLAKKLGLSDSEIELVKYAGLLHDIGKIGISELILNKAGRLTNPEFDEIKKHPELGARIIADVPFLKALVPLVLHHHEFFTGGGYPSGIAGNEIPLGARILSVSDAYEAMTSNRPYRNALPQDVALDILKKESGRQFDPQIVKAFLEIMLSSGD